MRAWGITDGSAGMVAQVRALAGALGVPVEMKTIALKPYYAWVPNVFYAAGQQAVILSNAIDTARSDALTAPWPELVISCGRKAALVAMGLKYSSLRAQRSNPELDRLGPSGLAMTKFIHIQDPQCPPENYDLVIAMAHDKVQGANVIKTRFALHGITPEVLAAARAQWTPRFLAYGAPRVAVLLGGSTNKYTLKPRAMRQVVAALDAFARASGASLLITPSRRTGAENVQMLQQWKNRHSGDLSPEASTKGESRNTDQTPQQVRGDNIYIYDGNSENPYMGLLALADAIIVTNDSVNMMSEAHATGKPLYILPLPGHKNTKPARFAESLVQDGIARPLGITLEAWPCVADDTMAPLVHAIRAKLS